MQRVITCPHCGIQFTGSHPLHTYCSGACRTAAYRDRHAPGSSALDVRAWEGTAIQRRRADGYVNATAMCKANGREWSSYARTERTKEYIKALDAVLQNCGTELVQSIWGGRPELQGTWIHPRLAVDLARWISPAFAVWMDGWFLESAQGQGRQPAPPKPRPARRRRPLQAAGPTQITWGDRVTLIGLAEHAREIDAAVTKILRSGVLSE